MPPALTLSLLLVVALLAALACVLHALARTLLHPPRMTEGKALYRLRRMSPADVGLAFEPQTFVTPALRMAAWWIPAAGADRTCLLIHGYADAKVGALAWAPLWHGAGWNLLLIDLRAHGESGGDACTGGYFERDDVDAVLNELRAARPAASRRLALFGVSLGGAVALATAARRTDVDAVVADGVFADYAEAAHAHGVLIGAPTPRLIPCAVRWAERLAGARFGDVRPVDAIARCSCPVMLIHGGADAFVPAAAVARLHAALAARRDALDVADVIPGAGHCLSLAADPDRYARRLGDFLARAVR